MTRPAPPRPRKPSAKAVRKPLPPFQPDATALAIVAQLRRNGRASNQRIAETLDLTATTVSTRIRRMEDAGQLRVVAVSDFATLGYNVLLRVTVEVDGRPASEVAAELAQLPQVFAAHIVVGCHDIDMLVALRDFEDLSALLFDQLSTVRGIRTLTPDVVIDVVKYTFDVAPLAES